MNHEQLEKAFVEHIKFHHNDIVYAIEEPTKPASDEAVEALIAVFARNSQSRRSGWGPLVCDGWGPLACDAITAIRRGEVPGIWCGELAENIASAQLVATLRARVSELEAGLKERCETGSEFARKCDRLEADLAAERERAEKLNGQVTTQSHEICRLEVFNNSARARAEAAELLLRKCGCYGLAKERDDPLRR